jgi:hypothetical protein
MYRAKQGAKTEKENRNFFHGPTGSPVVLHKPDKKGSAPAHPVSQENLNSRKRTQRGKAATKSWWNAVGLDKSGV